MFLWCSNLESVVIGSNIKEIRSNAFANCKSLQNIYCYSEIVPETDEWAFWSIEGAYNATLHVPESSVDTYKNTIPWNAFKNIISLNDDDPKADIKTLIFEKKFEIVFSGSITCVFISEKNTWYPIFIF